MVSFGQTFIKGDDVLLVSSHLSAFIEHHNRESHCKQRRNFPYTVFAVLGKAAATSNNTKENSLPTSSVSQSWQTETANDLPPSVTQLNLGQIKFILLYLGNFTLDAFICHTTKFEQRSLNVKHELQSKKLKQFYIMQTFPNDTSWFAT